MIKAKQKTISLAILHRFAARPVGPRVNKYSRKWTIQQLNQPKVIQRDITRRIRDISYLRKNTLFYLVMGQFIDRKYFSQRVDN